MEKIRFSNVIELELKKNLCGNRWSGHWMVEHL